MGQGAADKPGQAVADRGLASLTSTSNGCPSRSELPVTRMPLATMRNAASAGLSQPMAAQATPSPL